MSNRFVSQYMQQLWHSARTALDAYSIRMSFGLVLSLLMMVVLTRMPIYSAPEGQLGWGPRGAQERIHLTDLAQTTPDETPPPTPQASDVPVTVHSDPRSAPESSQDESEQDEALQEDSAPTEPQKTYTATELATLGPSGEQPEIIGGPGSLYLNIEYPEEARRQGIQGRVILDFVVDTEGRTQNIRVTKSLHPLCDSSAVAALERTRFVPGKRNGEPVPVRMRLPVRFRIVNLTAQNDTAEKTNSSPDGQHPDIRK